MEQGWIYVLVNSSLPGLVKVGRTSRSTQERVAELSAATRVPTPFVLAFDQEFEDCVAAEQSVHAELERRGQRIAANREFFRGSPAEIVRVVLEVAAAAGAGPAFTPARSGIDLVADGDSHLNGTGETLQDLPDAVRCYRLAAARGSLVAHERLGAIFADLTPQTRSDRRRTMRHLKEGARRGNYFCYCEMGRVFARDVHPENFAKAWDLFFARRADSFLPEVEPGEQRYLAALLVYIGTCLELGVQPRHVAELRALAENLLEHLLQGLDRVRDAPEARQRLARILRWSYENLSPQPPPVREVRRLGSWWKAWRGAAPGVTA
jgi:hypothetical protein